MPLINMGKTKPVWLVALQSAAEGMMGNRLLTREEFEKSLQEIIDRTEPKEARAKRSRKKRVEVSSTDWDNLRPDGTRYRVRTPMNVGPGQACPLCGRTEPRNRFG